MKKRILTLVLLSLLPLQAMAHEKSSKHYEQPLLTSDMVDPVKHCVYESKLYSRGSVIKQGAKLYVCEKVSRPSEPFSLGWDKD